VLPFFLINTFNINNIHILLIVITIPKTNIIIICNICNIFCLLIFHIVIIKFIAPNNVLIAAKYKAITNKSTDHHNNPPLVSFTNEPNNAINDGANNHNDSLFSRGFAISVDPVIFGTK